MSDYYDRNDDDRRRGLRERDWSDEIAERDGRMRDNGRDGSDAASQRRREPRPRRDMYDENPSGERPQKKSFGKRHPVLANMFYIVVATVALLWILMWFLDYWTFHGQEQVVPDVKNQTYDVAASNVDLCGLRPIISDSVFDSYQRPGTVVEQTPVAGARIKKGGSVYLKIVAFSPKLVTVPDFYNMSVRQARSAFEASGITDIRQVEVLSDYSGLVLGAKFNGVALQPGAKIPVSAVVTLEVGSGIDDSDVEMDSLSEIIDMSLEELDLE